MAELAFESIVRLGIAVVVFALIIAVANQLFAKIVQNTDFLSVNTTTNEDVIIKGKVSKEGFIGLFEKCYTHWHEEIPNKEEEICYIVLNADETALRSAAGSLPYVKIERSLSEESNVVIAYRVSDDTVVVK